MAHSSVAQRTVLGALGCAGALIGAAGAPAYAQLSSSGGPISYSAGTLEYFDTERRLVLTGDVDVVQGDARLLQRALMNLAWNALRHGRRGGTVTLSLTADAPSGYTLTVHDEGAGFPPEQLAALTQAYAQGGGDARGFGLGLALVCLVADKHRARTVATHPPDGGFSIAIRFVADVEGPDLPAGDQQQCARRAVQRGVDVRQQLGGIHGQGWVRCVGGGIVEAGACRANDCGQGVRECVVDRVRA